MDLAIYGTGGSGREVFELSSSLNAMSNRWEKLLFLDDFTEDTELYGAPILSFERMRSLYIPGQIEVIIAVGEPGSRELLYSKVVNDGYDLATIIHPDAFVSPSAKLGSGVFVKMQSIISADAIVEDNVFIQANVIVGHDVRVGKHTQISAYSHIAGHASLGERNYLGVRASIREECSVGDDVVIAMGAVVMEKKVPSKVLAVGNPAKYVRRKSGSRVFS